MTWNRLKVFVTTEVTDARTAPLTGVDVTFILMTEDSSIQYETIVTSDSTGYATLNNTPSVIYKKTVFTKDSDAGTKKATYVTSEDSDFEKITCWMTSVENGRGVCYSTVYQMSGGIEDDGNVVEKQATSSSLKFVKIYALANYSYVNFAHCTWVYSINGRLIDVIVGGGTANYGVTINQSDYDMPILTIKSNISTYSNGLLYTNFDTTNHVVGQTAETYTRNVELTETNKLYFRVSAATVCDTFFYNAGSLYMDNSDGTEFRIYDNNGNIVKIQGVNSGYIEPGTNIFGVTFIASASTPYVHFNMYPDGDFTTGATLVNLIEYPYITGRTNYFQVNGVVTEVFANTYQIELPKIVDNAVIYQETDYPVYNLRDTDIVFQFVSDKNGTFNISANSYTDNYLTLCYSAFGGTGIFNELIQRLTSEVPIAESTERLCKFKLSKKNYKNATYYAAISSKTVTNSAVTPTEIYDELYFCQVNINNSIPSTANVISESSERSVNNVATPYYKRLMYMPIYRNSYYAFREKDFCDFVAGFAYGYTGSGSQNYLQMVSEKSWWDTQYMNNLGKTCPSLQTFFNNCKTLVGDASGNYNGVSNFKTNFVGDELTTPYYGLEYTKGNAKDYKFPITGEDSGHSFTFNTYNFTFHPKTTPEFFTLTPDDEQEFYNVGLFATEGLTNYPSLEYRINNSTWADWGNDPTRIVQITNNDYIQFRNKVSHYQDGAFSSPNGYVYVSFTIGNKDRKYKASGPLSSLVDKHANCDFVTGNSSFYRFFAETRITDAEDLRLDIKTISDSCYKEMFANCEELTKAPLTIEATSGGNSCFAEMFSGCTSMTQGPEKINLISYPNSACDRMFYDTSISYGPKLEKCESATTYFGPCCFNQMFENCINLRYLGSDGGYIGGRYDDSYTSQGVVHYTDNSAVLSNKSCYQMFKNCINLEKSPRFNPIYIASSGCYEMYYGCTDLTDTSFLMCNGKGIVGKCGCYSMFENCTSLNIMSGISLSGQTLDLMSYYRMFYNCKNVRGNLPVIQAVSIPASACAYMYAKTFSNTGVKKQYLDNFITKDFESVGNCGMYGMFLSGACLDFEPVTREFEYEYYTQSKLPVTIKATGTSMTNSLKATLKTAFSFPNGTDFDDGNTHFISESLFSEVPCVSVYDSTNKKYTLYTVEFVYNLSQHRFYINHVLRNLGTIDMYGEYYTANTSLNAQITVKHSYNNLCLNATSLSESCYAYMFDACDTLQYASHFILEAKTLQPKCYDHMFYHCDHLFSIPLSLSAVTLAASACQYMFAACGDFKCNNALSNNFNYVENILNSGYTNSYENDYYLYSSGLRAIQRRYNYVFDAYGKWVQSANERSDFAYVSSSGFEYDTEKSISYILTSGGTLPTGTSNRLTIGLIFNQPACNSAFYKMFYCCRGLKNANVSIPNEVAGASMFESMFGECFSLKQPPTFNNVSNLNASNTVGERAFFGMFKDCHELRSNGARNSRLGFTKVSNNTYYMMYHGCYKLVTGPAIEATAIGESSFAHMFKNCYRLSGLTLNTNGISMLPATTLAKNCYYSMFQNCMSLSRAPKLPASTLVQGCYNYMFAADCLWYYTGKTMYHIHATLTPSLVNGTGTPTTGNGYVNSSVGGGTATVKKYTDSSCTALVSTHTITLQSKSYTATSKNFTGERNTDFKLGNGYFGSYFYSGARLRNGSIWGWGIIDDTDGVLNGPSVVYGYLSPYSTVPGVYFKERQDWHSTQGDWSSVELLPEIDEYPYYEPTHYDNEELYELLCETGPFKLNTRYYISKNIHTYYKNNSDYLMAYRYGGSNYNNVTGSNNSRVTYRNFNSTDHGYCKIPDDELSFSEIKSKTVQYNYHYWDNDDNYCVISGPVLLSSASMVTIRNYIDNDSPDGHSYAGSFLNRFEEYRHGARYKIDEVTPITDEISEGYALNFHNDNGWYYTPGEIRVSNWYDLDVSTNQFQAENFHIPVNDATLWDKSLNEVTVSASSLNTTYAQGFMSMLNLTEGTFKGPGNKSQYTAVTPSNWTYTH